MAEKRLKIATVTGLFMLAGFVALAYLAINLGEIAMPGEKTYQLKASFTSVSGLREGSYVEAAGVRIGKVSRIKFNPEYFLAEVILIIDENVVVQEDAIASIRTAGIIGDKFIKISPGGSEEILRDGMEIHETEPSINLEELISKYIFESGN